MADVEDDSLEAAWDSLRVVTGAPKFEAPPPTFGSSVKPGDFVIGTSKDRILVIIKPNGDLEYGPEYHPVEAAQVFWESMGQRRLEMEDRLLVIEHMESILVRVGQQDRLVERLRREAALIENPVARSAADQMAQMATHTLELVLNQAIELGRGLAARDLPVPEVPAQIPVAIQNNPNSDYQGIVGISPDFEPLA